jgi:hypothetical protein
MERTRYRDGIEVDQSDLTNTETTKSTNILMTRKDLEHFGVVEGLEVSSPDGITLTINVGRAYAKNGELIEVTSPMTNVTGASIQASVFSLVGLRVTEVTTTPKAHESDPITENTRIIPKIVAELFVASDASTTSELAAKAQASSAALTDENFVPLAIMYGTGTTVGQPSEAILARTKGGLFPAISNASNEQLTALQSVYNDTLNDEKPIHSAEDHFHRGLLGSAIPNSRNPHGLLLDDIGFNTGDIVRQARVSLTNGILGLESSGDDFNPDSGSFAFDTSDAQTQVTVNGLASGETCIINNTVFTEADFPASTNVSFAGAAAGFYYIVIQYGTGFALAIKRMDKATLDGYCPDNNGKPVWLNNAVEPTSSEKQYLVIGCVYWDTTQFVNLNIVSQITFPTGGDLVYTVGGAGNFGLLAEKRLDLRRYGVTSTETVQKYTLRADRLGDDIVTRTNFGSVHASYAATNLVTRGFGSSPKHLTDNQARTVFGHAYVGGAEHSLVTASNAGFMSGADKTKLDSLGGDVWGITLLKWGDINVLSKKGEKAMGDAAANADAGDDSDEKSYKYVFVKPGRLQNFSAYLGVGTQKNKWVRVFIYVWQWGQAVPNPQVTLQFNPTATHNVIDQRVTNITSTIDVPANGVIMVTRRYQYDGSIAKPRPKNLTVTCEYAFTL